MAKLFDVCIYCEMISTVSLVNIYHDTQLQDFFSDDETFYNLIS